MSIRINNNCVGCNKCVEVCPGNLIYKDENGKAYIKYPKDCWGCTACIKECRFQAIELFLGEDIGGKDGYLYTKIDGDKVNWHITSSKKQVVISTNRKESNKY